MIVLSGVINVGMIYLNILSTFSVVALAFADMVVLSSLAGLTIVFNTILAVKYQNETFTKYDFGCVVLTLGGATICVSFSNFNDVVISSIVSFY